MYNGYMKLSIEYSIDYNVERVIKTIKKMDWFDANGYKPILPKELIGTDLKAFTRDEVRGMIVQEYDEEKYKAMKVLIQESGAVYIPTLASAFVNTTLPIHEEYMVRLVEYGVGGSYGLPNTVILNIANLWGIGPIKTIIHEIIHLSIEELIIAYKIEHWQKERIVDRMFSVMVPEIQRKMQNISENVIRVVDEAFDRNYPNVEKVCAEIAQENNMKK